jgi:sec-independent protein translocase protein TatA
LLAQVSQLGNLDRRKTKMAGLGPTELIIILVIIIVLFGVGRISKIAGEMGSGIRAFKDGLQGDEDESEEGKESSEETASEES